MSNGFCSWCGDGFANPSEEHPRHKDIFLCGSCVKDYDTDFHCPSCGGWEDIYEIHTVKANRCVSISALGKVTTGSFSEIEIMDPGEEPLEVLYYMCYDCDTKIEKDEIDPTKKIESARAELEAMLDSI